MSDGFKQFVQELKNRVPIEDVVGEAVPGLRRSGRGLKGLCPFHGEKTPSFHVHPEFGFYRCFGCGAHGDVINFVMEHERVDFRMAVETLARRFGIAVPDFGPAASPAERDEQAERERVLKEICKAAEAFFVERLANHPDGATARDYLTGRGLTPEQIAEYRIGYAPPEYDSLLRELARRGYSGPRAVEAGLAFARDNGGFTDRFRDRVVFPIDGPHGGVVAFGGRLLRGEGPKYLNSADSPIFHKGKLLFGLAAAREAIRDEGRAVLLEGYMDWIALHAHGIRNVLAGLGTAFGEDQARLLRRIAKEAVLFYDGDAAGRKAAAKSAELLLAEGIKVRVAALPAGPVKHDPDSYIRSEGPAAVRKLLESARPAIDHFLDEAVAELKPFHPEAKAAVADVMAPLLKAVSDPVIQADYTDRVAARLGLDVSALGSRLKEKRPRRSEPPPEARDGETAGGEPGGEEAVARRGESTGLIRSDPRELYAVHWAVRLIESFEVHFQGFEPDLFSSPALGRVFARLAELAADIREGLEPPADWLECFEDEEERLALTRALLIEEHLAGGGLQGRLAEVHPADAARDLAEIRLMLLRRKSRRDRGEERLRATSGGHAENERTHRSIQEKAAGIVRESRLVLGHPAAEDE